MPKPNEDFDNMHEYIIKAQNGDKDAEEYIVKSNNRLIWSIVKKFQNRGYEVEDLFQIGALGLVKAIKKFDIRFNVKFSTYAVPMIMGEIKRFLRDDGIIKVSRSIKEIASRAKQARYNLNIELGREPTINEIAENLKVPLEELIMAMDSENIPESIYEVIHESENSNILLIDRLNSKGADETDMIDNIVLKDVLNMLEKKERQIIMMRYFQDRTQADVAKLLGISQVQVSRVEKRILQKLKKNLQ
jgi:RNA polymerase sporulation-specific sigma factor